MLLRTVRSCTEVHYILMENIFQQGNFDVLVMSYHTLGGFTGRCSAFCALSVVPFSRFSLARLIYSFFSFLVVSPVYVFLSIFFFFLYHYSCSKFVFLVFFFMLFRFPFIFLFFSIFFNLVHVNPSVVLLFSLFLDKTFVSSFSCSISSFVLAIACPSLAKKRLPHFVHCHAGSFCAARRLLCSLTLSKVVF